MSGRSTGWILSHFWHAAINQNVVDSWLQNRSQGYKNLYTYLWFYLISFCRRLIVKQKTKYKNALVCAMRITVTIAKVTSNVGKILFNKSGFMCRHCTNLKWSLQAKLSSNLKKILQRNRGRHFDKRDALIWKLVLFPFLIGVQASKSNFCVFRLSWVK